MNWNVLSRLVALAVAVCMGGTPVLARADEPVPETQSEQQMESLPTSEPAQTRAQPTGLEEIVVTARKRDELLQEVPISITAFSTEQLTGAKIGSMLPRTTLCSNCRSG